MVRVSGMIIIMWGPSGGDRYSGYMGLDPYYRPLVKEVKEAEAEMQRARARRRLAVRELSSV